VADFDRSVMMKGRKTAFESEALRLGDEGSMKGFGG
jgi:hypothetical protein